MYECRDEIYSEFWSWLLRSSHVGRCVMSVVLFIFASVVGYLLYVSFKREVQESLDKLSVSRTSSSLALLDSNSAAETCIIPGCKCRKEDGFFLKIMKTLHKGYQDGHALIHAKPSAFQFHNFSDRFKTLEDVTEAIREAGLEQCRLVIGIDFTASNEFQGRSSYKGHSLHYLSSMPRAMNPYQHVISILSRTLPELMMHEDKDAFLSEQPFALRKSKAQCIHAYGFGDTKTKDKGTFSLHPAHLPCSSFDELLKNYRDVVSSVVLDGPTSYAPVINKAIEIVEESNLFHILIIIADGQFVDEGPTAEAIIEASNHPLSIVVVGVGDGPWGMLMRFDDWLPQRRFDNFQFVECNKVTQEFGLKHADTALALHTLMEIPDQFRVVQQLGYLEKPPNLIVH